MGGQWRFDPAPQEDFAFSSPEAVDELQEKIEVPGQWFMQGFKVDGKAAYGKQFELPVETGMRWKLRFDADYSDCTVWVNGKEAGGHQG